MLFQYFTQSTSGTRRALAVTPPSMHGTDRRTQSHTANLVSHLLSELSASPLRPPLGQRQTNTRPTPGRLQTQMPRICTKHGTATLPAPGCFPPCQSVQSVSEATLKPHQSDIKAPTRRVDSQAIGTSKPPQGYLKATSRLPQSHLKAPPRLPQGSTKAPLL
jgi:hypothetical protein